MAIPYKPRIVRQPNSESAYVITCKTALAADLVKFLKEQSIPAELSGSHSVEHMESGSESESYDVAQIDLEPVADYQLVKRAVDSWLQKT